MGLAYGDDLIINEFRGEMWVCYIGVMQRAKFGNPVVHLETTASLLPNFLARSR